MDNPLENRAVRTVATEAASAVLNVAKRETNDMSPAAVAGAQPSITVAVAREVAPVIEHLTNNEPWYQSRVTLGALLTVIAAVAGIWGYSFPAETQSKILDTVLALAPLIGPLVGAAVVLWGRWVARKPIGA